MSYRALLDVLRDLGPSTVAFSGGVDSSLLLRAARDALGVDGVLALTVVTPYTPSWELEEARALAASLGVGHEIIELPFLEALQGNPADHCYTCKRFLFEAMLERASERGFPRVLDGTNVDDLADYRPGLRALAELEIHSPLRAAGLDKAAVRRASRELGLASWDTPACACLLSRLPIGARITPEVLGRIEAAELALHGLGFPAVRVRTHDDLARVEVPEARLEELFAQRVEVDRALRAVGYRYVTVELRGYRMGSQNAAPPEEDG